MITRYRPTAGVQRDASGLLMNFADHDALVKELLETVEEFLHQVERRETTAAEATKAIVVWMRMR